MILSKYRFLLGLVFLFIVYSCANPVTPEGGPKDIKPPKIANSDPPMLATHFHNKDIRITFNEYILLKDPNNQIIISPPNLPHTDIHLRGKSILIKLSDSLKPNTTYSINFGDAIEDLTENNILHDFTYTFSTGSYVDSLSLTGKVVNAFDLVPQKDVEAMLYVNENDTLPLDSLPFHVKPYYLAKTKVNGEFIFRNLKNAPFLLFALKDMNGDYIYDLPNENVAFGDSLVTGSYIRPDSLELQEKDTLKKNDSISPVHDTASASKNTITLNTLLLFEEFDSTQRILKADMVNDGEVGIFYRYPAQDPQFIPLNLPDSLGWMMPEFNATRDSVFLWLKNPGKDSLILRLVDKGITLDTARIGLKKKTPRKRKNDKGNDNAIRLQLTTNMPDSRVNQFKTDPIVIFSYPVTRQDLSRILLVDGKDTVRPKLSFADSVKRRLRISYKWKEESTYRLIIPDSVFQAINGYSNDSLILNFRTHGLRDLGSIQMDIHINNPSGNYLIQLLNEKEIVLDQKIISSSGTAKFEYLFPGKYKIKAIFDRNRNGHWDTGNFSKKLQPEKVSYYQKVIEVRANWDIEESWEL